MPLDINFLLEILIFDLYWPPKGDPQGMTRQSQLKSRSLSNMSIITEYMGKIWHKFI